MKARLNILISGGTGAGKTTLLNIMSSFIPAIERIITIEDSAELQLRQPHVVRLETRPANIEGQGEVAQRMLLVNALRMRPDRIIVGEVRGAEAVDMLQAMNTGHDGSLTTLHANTPRDGLARLETMISMASLELPEKAMRQQIASAINLVIQVSRLSDGTRKIIQISEIVGMEGDVITMQDIFMFEREGIAENDTVLGRFRASGIRPSAWTASRPTASRSGPSSSPTASATLPKAVPAVSIPGEVLARGAAAFSVVALGTVSVALFYEWFQERSRERMVRTSSTRCRRGGVGPRGSAPGSRRGSGRRPAARRRRRRIPAIARSKRRCGRRRCPGASAPSC